MHTDAQISERRMELLIQASKQDERAGLLSGPVHCSDSPGLEMACMIEPGVPPLHDVESYELAILHEKWHGIDVSVPDGYWTITGQTPPKEIPEQHYTREELRVLASQRDREAGLSGPCGCSDLAPLVPVQMTIRLAPYLVPRRRTEWDDVNVKVPAGYRQE